MMLLVWNWFTRSMVLSACPLLIVVWSQVAIANEEFDFYAALSERNAEGELRCKFAEGRMSFVRHRRPNGEFTCSARVICDGDKASTLRVGAYGDGTCPPLELWGKRFHYLNSLRTSVPPSEGAKLSTKPTKTKIRVSVDNFGKLADVECRFSHMPGAFWYFDQDKKLTAACGGSITCKGEYAPLVPPNVNCPDVTEESLRVPGKNQIVCPDLAACWEKRFSIFEGGEPNPDLDPETLTGHKESSNIASKDRELANPTTEVAGAAEAHTRINRSPNATDTQVVSARAKLR